MMELVVDRDSRLKWQNDPWNSCAALLFLSLGLHSNFAPPQFLDLLAAQFQQCSENRLGVLAEQRSGLADAAWTGGHPPRNAGMNPAAYLRMLELDELATLLQMGIVRKSGCPIA